MKAAEKLHLAVRKGFKWWWAFCKKYSIISLYFDNSKENENTEKFLLEEAKAKQEEEEGQDNAAGAGANPSAANLAAADDHSEDDKDIDVEGLDEDASPAPPPHSSPLFHSPSPLHHLSSPPPAHANSSAQAHAAAAAFMAFFPNPLMSNQFLPYVMPQSPPVQGSKPQGEANVLKPGSSLTAAKWIRLSSIL